tara:strand:+ start:4156 stop:4902 length:747 start_codon:yes stop_codon:yes gene_type:complete
MALINFIETFFFISLAIAFILIVMLVYHFKDRLGLLEQKCDTMFEILNNMIKEMKNIKQQTMMQVSERQIQMNQNHVLSQPVQSNTDFDESDVDSDIDSDIDSDVDSVSEFHEEVSNVITTNNSENSFKKIVVEDVLEEPHKIQKIDNDIEDDNELQEQAINSITDNLEELEIDSIGETLDVPSENGSSENDESEDLVDNENHMKIDYKTLEISVLRAMVTSRGISDDVKKTKKSELIKMLQNADTSN